MCPNQSEAGALTWPDILRRTRARHRSMRVPPIPVTVAGYQSDRQWPPDRIPTLHEPRLPTLTEGRNNLTALSQYRNLLFIAFRGFVHVHVPQYPEQSFEAGPILVLDPPPSSPHLRGYIDSFQPNAINHLITADLGTQEILVCARDDGDVFAYGVDQIYAAVQSTVSSAQAGLGSDRSREVTPFFRRNLGISAWGIAVHKEARMIAFSSNYHLVTVFAFGLASRGATEEDATSFTRSTSHSQSHGDLDADMSDDGGVSLADSEPNRGQEESGNPGSTNIDAHEIEHERYHGITYPDNPHTESLFESRAQDFVIRLGRLGGGEELQHRANIPSIAFCNTPEDPKGRFLVSSDIDARTIVWDLKSARPTRTMFRNINDDYSEGPVDWRRSGWGMLWLDKQMFSHASSIRHATGTEKLRWPANIARKDACVISIAEAMVLIEHNDRSWVDNAATRELSDYAAPLDEATPPGTPNLDAPDAATAISDEVREIAMNNETDITRRYNMRELSDAYAFAMHPGTTEEAHKNDPNYWSLCWPIMTMAADSFAPTTTELPSNPLLLLSMNTMHLLQDADFPRISPSHPVVYLDKPLEQPMDQEVEERLGLFDRLNLFAQIPELGVVVVGSGKGRAAVCTLHQINTNPLLEASTTRKGKSYSTPSGSSSKPLYTFRVDHLLPFHQQERACQRPETWLVGLAVSPVQGGLDERQAGGREKPTLGRWRLILTYADFTTFSYEIGEAGTGSGPAVLV